MVKPSVPMDHSKEDFAHNTIVRVVHGNVEKSPVFKLPDWKFSPLQSTQTQQPEASKDSGSLSPVVLNELNQYMKAMNLGTYRRENVSNINDPSEVGRQYFDMGLLLMMTYQHELAAHFFGACLHLCPHAVLAHGLISLCHGPNYNFSSGVYYESTNRDSDASLRDAECPFPSQHVADRHSAAAIAIVDALNARVKTSSILENNTTPKNSSGLPGRIDDIEAQFLIAIRLLTGKPGVDPASSSELVGRPYAEAMRAIHQNYPNDPDIAYFFIESLMVLNAWNLYEYPSGMPMSPEVVEMCTVLQLALASHPNHPGLCHMYVHLSEMSAHPERALAACETLRSKFPDAGHLVHMPTHIDVLLGDYESCVRYNLLAIEADLKAMELSPSTGGFKNFYFSYMMHNFHMAVYGAILGGMEGIGRKVSHELNELVKESMFHENPSLVVYLEAYSALDIHVLVRFGRWEELLLVEMPQDETLMLFRSAAVLYGRALALAILGKIDEAKNEADRFDALRSSHPEASHRILHNNTVASLLNVDSLMMRGEIAYKEGKHEEGLELLREAVDMQDKLNYDEPWGKMQPIRHALGGLLLEQGSVDEAEAVFRKDLTFHPKNPWALSGLIRCLEMKNRGCCCGSADSSEGIEIARLKNQLQVQRQMEWADFDIIVACECCSRPVD